MISPRNRIGPERQLTLLACLALASLATDAAELPFAADPPKVCDGCDKWNAPQSPYRIFGNTYFVGTGGLSSILIVDEAGLVLLDGGLPQSAPAIAAHVRELGFRIEDVKLIVNSHTHYDHAGGLAALQRASGARVAASPPAMRALQKGGPTPDDPQAAFSVEHNAFAPVARVFSIKDGETLRVGRTAITAHFTPGHTPGGTSWTWRACEAAGRCFNLAYVDSLTTTAAPGYRFSGDATHPSLIARFENSIARVAALPCDILLTPHPDISGLPAKAQRAAAGEGEAFVDPEACRRLAENARANLARRVAEEQR